MFAYRKFYANYTIKVFYIIDIAGLFLKYLTNILRMHKTKKKNKNKNLKKWNSETNEFMNRFDWIDAPLFKNYSPNRQNLYLLYFAMAFNPTKLFQLSIFWSKFAKEDFALNISEYIRRKTLFLYWKFT